MSNKDYFFSKLDVLSLKVKGIHYSSRFDDSILLDDFFEDNYHLSLDYDVLFSSQNEREFIILIPFAITDKSIVEGESEEDDTVHNYLTILVEGVFLIPKSVKKKDINECIHYDGLGTTVAYLRTVIHNITSITNEEPIELPLIDLSLMHQRHNEELEREEKEKENSQQNKGKKRSKK